MNGAPSIASSASTPPAAHGNAATLAVMGGCYAMGTFTDNFYKQAAILLAAGSQMTGMQSIATVLFSLPFILFSAWAGAVADRVSKKTVVVAVKAAELAALLIGGVMLVFENWYGMLAVMFCMGTQSAFFSPAINGSIPENFPPSLVPRANSLIKLGSTAAILAGMAAAGFVLDLQEADDSLIFWSYFGLDFGRVMAALVVAVVAALGLITALVLRRRPAVLGREQRPAFPWAGPIDSLRQAWSLRRDKPLMLVLLADAWFFGIAAIAVISIANLAVDLAYSKSVAGVMTAMLMIGVAVGSLIAGRFSASSWRQLLVPSACGMALMLALAGLTPLLPPGAGGAGFPGPQLLWFGGCLLLAGVCGGLYLIPLESYIQVRPAADSKGRVIAVSNFLSFLAMALFGAAFKLISLLPPALTFVFYALATVAFICLLAVPRLSRLEADTLEESAASPLGFFMRLILSLRYKVSTTGLDALPPAASTPEAGKPGVLILPNHPALIDPVIVYSLLAGLRPRPLSDENQLRGPLQRLARRIIRAVTIPDPAKAGKTDMGKVREGLDAITRALGQGDNILLYPAGQIYRRGREAIGGKSAVAHILKQVPGARVLLVRTKGLWGSGFSHASGRAPSLMRQLGRGLITVLGNLILFVPKRPVQIDVVEPGVLAAMALSGDKKGLNRYLEDFYNAIPEPPRRVRRFFWQRREPATALAQGEEAPGQESTGASGAPAEIALCDVPAPVREKVYAILREQAGMARDERISPTQSLSADLFLDSLSLMTTAVALEEAFGYPVGSPAALVTVDDCLRAATGQLETPGGAPASAPVVPEAWFAADDRRDAEEVLGPEPGKNIVEAFLRLARKDPSRPLTGGREGLRSRRQILTGMLALSARFRALPGTRLGIMLPPVPAALVVWLAAMHAGKEPVFVNWTVGRVNLEHCLVLSGVSHIVSAGPLLTQLERSGVALPDLPGKIILADKVAASLSLREKARAALLATLHCLPLPFSLSARKVRERAAILFTSGSESRPKGVPLTHANLMTNAADVLGVLRVRKRDRLLAMLPPFHSFGLLAGLVLPAATGMPSAYHPNPTESAALAALVRDYRLSLLGATPTFLEGMLAKAGPGGALASLRYAFVGAEKCPDRVYRAFGEQCPQAALCEGYGITECSPVVAVNRPDAVVPGTVGQVMPSVEAVIVLESAGAGASTIRTRAGTGETGMLLVRGPSIFSGYLEPVGAHASPAPDPFVEFEAQRWYRTGDLIRADADGRLTFMGRLKRFVKIGGEMISLPQMEDALQRAFAGRDDLPGDGRPYLAVEAVPGSEEAGQAELLAYTTLPLAAQEINLALRAAGLSPLYSVRRTVRLREIPLLGSGKIDYRALAAAAVENVPGSGPEREQPDSGSFNRS